MIVVAGEALIDLIVDHTGGIKAAPGGGPYNAARTLGRLGADCTYLGVFGDDHFGELLRSGLSDAGVHLACPNPLRVPTTLAVAQLGSDGAATYRFYLEGTSLPMLSAPRARTGLPAEFGALHVGSLGLVVEPTATVLEELATDLAGTHPIVLDPNCRPFVIPDYPTYRARMMRLFAIADLVKLSSDDAQYLFPNGGFAEAIQAIISRGGIVLHTDGPGPIDVYATDGKASVMPLTGDIVDTVGAGDIFGATVLWALSKQGWAKGQRLGLAQVLSAAQTAAVAAHLGCQRAGAEPPSLAELTERLQVR